MDKPAEFKKLDCNRCGAPNWSRQHEGLAEGTNVRNAKRLATTQKGVEHTKE